jgi:hypothetical protein
MKKQMTLWPHNNTPSSRHVWGRGSYKGATAQWSGYSANCLRCGCHFNERADTRAPVYCVPTVKWLKNHPEDDGRAGDGDTRHAAKLGMGKP